LASIKIKRESIDTVLRTQWFSVRNQKGKKREKERINIPRGVVVLGMHGGVVGKAMIGMGGSVVHTIKAW